MGVVTLVCACVFVCVCVHVCVCRAWPGHHVAVVCCLQMLAWGLLGKCSVSVHCIAS